MTSCPCLCEGYRSDFEYNRIPADSFLTEITPERYRDWLQLMVDGNQNMVRVWAGGIYEPDVFYDICDGKND
jgi:beta-mannosidase